MRNSRGKLLDDAVIALKLNGACPFTLTLSLGEREQRASLASGSNARRAPSAFRLFAKQRYEDPKLFSIPGERNKFPPLPKGEGRGEGERDVRCCSARQRFGRLVLFISVLLSCTAHAASSPIYAGKGVVVSQSDIASQVGADVLRDGGNATDAAVATAFALAVTHPTAGNIGGGGFLVFRSASDDADAYDFRETAPAKAHAEMFKRNGKYDSMLHHEGHLSVGVPGTVAGLHLVWRDHGKLPWKRLVEPSIKLARDGFTVSHGLARDLEHIFPRLSKHPASLDQFYKRGKPYQPGDILKQSDLAPTLTRIAKDGPRGFYEGETAALIEKEMLAHGGLITRDDLKSYTAKKRTPVHGNYRGFEIISMPPPSSGGVALIEMLNVLEGFDLRTNSFGSAANIHLMAETMRRGFADRAQFLGDPDFTDIPSRGLLRRNTRQSCAKRFASIARRVRRRMHLRGQRRATRPHTSRSWTKIATRWR